MNKTVRNIFFSALAALAGSAAMTSCSMVYEPEENNCIVRYQVRFRYDRNMKFADAFPAEVEEVTLHLIDGDGNIAWSKTESGEALAREGYRMDVDVEPGTYSLMAWCSSADPTTFDARNDGTHSGLEVHFNTASQADNNDHITDEIDRLYHGFEADVEFPDVESGDFLFTVPLTKDTNHFVITLQQLSGEPIDHRLVEFEITDNNAHLGSDNLPIDGYKPTVYHHWHSETVEADLSASRAETSTFAGVVAELTTSRLMTDSDARLKVYRNDTGETIASIRLIDAVLLVMGQENSRRLTKQQYLDYKDEYNMTFFLDQNHKWLNGLMQIESWRRVYREEAIES